MSTDRLVLLFGLLAAAAVLAVLVLPVAGGRVYFASDLGEYHLPLRWFYARSLATGDDFRWCPDLYCGFDLHGEGQLGMLHPLHLMLYRLLPLETAFNLELLASYPLMLLGMFLWLRRWDIGPGAALFGGLCFAFSGFNLLHLIHPNGIAVIAHLPWLLWAVDLTCRSAGRPAATAPLAVAGLTASQLLLGYPQYVFLTMLAELLYLLLLRPGWRPLARLAVAKGLGVLVGCAQLLPTWAAAAASTRADPGSAFQGSFALHPFDLAQLLAPYLLSGRSYRGYTHETAPYAGAVALVLLAWLVARRDALEPGRRRLALGAAALGLAALWLALGHRGGLYTLLARLPLIDLFRAPSRFLVLVHLALAATSAVALADLAGGRALPPRRRLWPLAALLAASLALAAVWFWPRAAARLAGPWHALAGPALFGAATLLLLLAGRGSRAALAGLVLLGAADLGYSGLSWLWRYPPATELSVFAAGVPGPPSPTGRRVAGARNALTLRGIKLADGYLGLPPRHDRDLTRLLDLQRAGVEWRVAGGVWLRVPDPLPRARLTGGAGAARLVADRPGRIELNVDAERATRLVVAESFHPGWQATLDGQPVPTLRAAGDFLACDVPAGHSRVAWRFRAESHRNGMWLCVIGLAGVALWLVVVLVRDPANQLPS